MTEDIEFCLESVEGKCSNRNCERHKAKIRCFWFDHSFMSFADTEFCIGQGGRKTDERKQKKKESKEGRRALPGMAQGP